MICGASSCREERKNPLEIFFQYITYQMQNCDLVTVPSYSHGITSSRVQPDPGRRHHLCPSCRKQSTKEYYRILDVFVPSACGPRVLQYDTNFFHLPSSEPLPQPRSALHFPSISPDAGKFRQAQHHTLRFLSVSNDDMH